jgi:hypothetical protein
VTAAHSTPADSGALCACGCGDPLPPSKTGGRPRRHLPGHHPYSVSVREGLGPKPAKVPAVGRLPKPGQERFNCEFYGDEVRASECVRRQSEPAAQSATRHCLSGKCAQGREVAARCGQVVPEPAPTPARRYGLVEPSEPLRLAPLLHPGGERRPPAAPSAVDAMFQAAANDTPGPVPQPTAAPTPAPERATPETPMSTETKTCNAPCAPGCDREATTEDGLCASHYKQRWSAIKRDVPWKPRPIGERKAATPRPGVELPAPKVTAKHTTRPAAAAKVARAKPSRKAPGLTVEEALEQATLEQLGAALRKKARADAERLISQRMAEVLGGEVDRG